jgi:hypothetical protein
MIYCSSVHKNKLVLLILCFITFVQVAKGQILDDSTKQVYGPETSRYYYEKDLRLSNDKTYAIDTLIGNLHHITQPNRFQNQMQDLGNLGTPARFLFYQPPSIIGAHSGYNVFDVFFKDPSRVKYYDTRSPFTQLYHVLGGNNRSITEVDYSRNINPQWNIGGNYHRIIADKQFGARASRGDRHAESNNYYFYTGYKSKDQKYHLLAHFSRMNHKVRENGGVIEHDVFGLYDRRNNIFLRNAQSSELRTNYHLYHQYKLSKQLQFYHSMDRTKQAVAFKVNFSGEEINYFNNIFISKDSTRDRSEFKVFANEVGVKGGIENLHYNFYAKRRDVKFTSRAFEDLGYTAEHYLGSNLRYNLTPGLYGEVFGEYMIGGNYQAGFNIGGKNLGVNYTKSQYQPAYMHQRFTGNHQQWENNLESILSDHLKFAYGIQTSFLTFRPNVTLTNIQNNVVFNAQQRAVQTKGDVQIISPGLDLNLLFFKRIHWDNSLILSRVYGAASNTYRLPEIFANSRIYYSNFLFSDKLQLQAGIDIHGRSAYQAMGYSTSLQQFYLQNETTLPAFVTADIFVNMKINKFRLFLKMVNVNQGFPDEGYQLTPLHPGQGRTFDFGFNWLFFD